MELHEFHVAQLSARAPGDGQSVAGGDFGIGGFTKHLPTAAGAENGLLRPDQSLAVMGMPHQRSAASAVVREQINRKSVLPGLHIRKPHCVIDHGAHYFLAGGVPQGVNDAIVAVAAFAPQRDFTRFGIEMRPPFDQFANMLGRFSHDHFHDPPVAQLAAGRERVGNVIFKSIFRIEYAGDATLCVGTIRLANRLFRNDQNRKLRINRIGRPQPRQPAADDEYIRKMMRHPLRVERNEITGAGVHARASWRENVLTVAVQCNGCRTAALVGRCRILPLIADPLNLRF